MKDIFSFNKNNIMRVKGETLSGVLLDVNAFLTDAETVCDIKNLNKIQIELSVQRRGQNKKDLFNGKLDDLLTGLYANSMKYANCVKKLSSGYKMLINFSGILELGQEDVLTIAIKPDQSAFHYLALTPSTIEVETVPAYGRQTILPLVESISIGNGKNSLDENLGSNVVAIVIANDFTAPYDASTKAKTSDINMTATGFEKDVSENLLIAENMEMLEENPETAVKQLVVYRAKSSREILEDVRLKANFSEAVDDDARLIILKTLWV